MKRTARRMLVLGVAATAASLLVAGWLHTFRVTSGFAVSMADLHSRHVPASLAEVLPAGASDIWYLCNARSASADVSFSLSETEFLAWAEKRGWRVRAVSEEWQIPLTTYDQDERVQLSVEDGYSFSNFEERQSGGYVIVAYDRIRRRVYLSVGSVAG